MGLRRNIIASYASQGYVTLVSIVTMPLYLRYLGAEAYGLVGFFLMLQAWFMLLDMGLTPTVARETARFHGKAILPDDYRTLVRVVELLFLAMAVAGGTLLLLGADAISRQWLQVREMPITEVANALRIMAVIVALRWMCGLYRSIVTGSERFVWLSNFGALVATVRFVGVLLVLEHVGATVAAFFWYQLAVAIVEFAVLAQFAHRFVPARQSQRTWREAITVVKPLIGFSLSLAFTASVWVFVTQTDKLILSKLLPLGEYGYFTLAVLVAGGVMVLSGPVTGVIQPRLARMEAERNVEGLIAVYRRSTQFVVVVAAATSMTLALSAEPLLFAWTGDRTLASNAWPVLALYALGNGVLAVSAFPYYLQYAKGNLHMHVIGNVLFVILLIPSIIWSARSFGGTGAGFAWLATNVVYLVVWAPLVHRRLEPGLNQPWFGRDIAAVVAPMVVVALVASTTLSPHDGRWATAMKIAVMCLVIAVVGTMATTTGWARTRRALAGLRTTKE